MWDRKKGQPDCIWMKKDGSPVAVFEVEGYDVEDKYTGGLMKDGIYLSSPEFSKAVRVIILFGLRADRKAKKNVPKFPEDPISELQMWVKKRCKALACLYNVPAEIPIMLDDEITKKVIRSWVKKAKEC